MGFSYGKGVPKTQSEEKWLGNRSSPKIALAFPKSLHKSRIRENFKGNKLKTTNNLTEIVIIKYTCIKLIQIVLEYSSKLY